MVPLRAVVAATVLAAGAAGAWAWTRAGTERLIARGEWDAAKAAIDARAAEKGDEDPRVLYLRGRLEAARVETGEGGSLRHAFALWSRGLAAGSGDALGALEDAARAWECDRRRLAARALADSGSRDALGALRRLAEAEPPPADTVGKVKRFFGADGACGAGDVARDGIEQIEREGR